MIAKPTYYHTQIKIDMTLTRFQYNVKALNDNASILIYKGSIDKIILHIYLF